MSRTHTMAGIVEGSGMRDVLHSRPKSTALAATLGRSGSAGGLMANPYIAFSSSLSLQHDESLLFRHSGLAIPHAEFIARIIVDGSGTSRYRFHSNRGGRWGRAVKLLHSIGQFGSNLAILASPLALNLSPLSCTFARTPIRKMTHVILT